MREVLQKNYVDKGKLYLTITEFCNFVDISVPSYFKLRKLGLAPEEARFPGTVIIRISIESLDAWMGARENPGPAEAALIEAEKAKLRTHAQLAVQAGMVP